MVVRCYLELLARPGFDPPLLHANNDKRRRTNMGSSLSIKMGVGLEIPTEDDGMAPEVAAKAVEYLDPNPHFIIDREEFDGEVYIDYDDYEIFDALGKKFPLLSFSTGYCYDYTNGAVVLVKRLSSSGYDGAAEHPIDNLSLSEDEQSQLSRVAMMLGIEYNPVMLALPSYG